MNLKRQIMELIDTVEDDQALADELHKLDQAHSWEFAGLVSSWGPKLYERNPRVFLPLIERLTNSWNVRRTADLKGWLDQAEANNHTGLYRTLLEAWLIEEYSWAEAVSKWEEMLLGAFRAADTRADRRDVIDKYNIWYDISDDFATALYRVDPVVTRSWVLDRLDRLEWHEIIYEKLARVALENGDRDFYFELYRQTFTQQMWEPDVEEILANVTDPTELCDELERRHLAGAETFLSPDAYIKVLEARGEDVLPYVLKHIPNTWSWGYVAPAWKKILSIAQENEWWNLWTTVVRHQSNAKTFTETVQRLLESDWPEWHVAALLGQVAGATYGGREWRRPAPLSEETAVALYERFPEFVRGPYAFHLVMTRVWKPGQSNSHEARFLDLAQLAMRNEDHAIVDILAGRGIEQAGNIWRREPVEGLGWYVQYYAKLGDEAFAERAFGVLERLPPFEFLGRELRREGNDLYGVFFDEPSRYRSRAADAGELLESANEDVRRLGLRILAKADRSVAIATARENIDHLLAYLLNESTRSTRIAAFDALALAAESSEEVAGLVDRRARGALRLRRRDYPRDRLVELIGRVIHRWPSLRRESEAPLIYERDIYEAEAS